MKPRPADTERVRAIIGSRYPGKICAVTPRHVTGTSHWALAIAVLGQPGHAPLSVELFAAKDYGVVADECDRINATFGYDAETMLAIVADSMRRRGGPSGTSVETETTERIAPETDTQPRPLDTAANGVRGLSGKFPPLPRLRGKLL